jgi:hypothetical protein
MDAFVKMLFGQADGFTKMIQLFFRGEVPAATRTRLKREFRLPDGPDPLFFLDGNDVHRADIGAGAAGNAIGRRLVEGGGNPPCHAPSFKPNGGNTHHFTAGPDTLSAKDTTLDLDSEAGILNPQFIGDPAQYGVGRIPGQQQFDDELADIEYALGLGLDQQVLGHLIDARGNQPRALAVGDLHHTDATGAVGFKFLVTAKVGDPDISGGCRFHDGGALGCIHLPAIDRKGYHVGHVFSHSDIDAVR